MKLTELARDRAEIFVTPYEGAEVRVWVAFRPGRVTVSSQELLEQSMKGGGDRPVLEWLSGTILDWDLEDDHGQKVDYTDPEVLADLPSIFLQRLVIQVYEGAATVPESNTGD